MSIGLGLLSVVLWLLLSGYFTNVLLLTLGALSCAAVVYVTHRMRLFDTDVPSFRFVVRTMGYLPWLMMEIVKSNIDVARRILDPRLPISPTLVRIKTSQRTDLGRAVHANSITLTPGTVTLFVDDGLDEMEIHALSQEAARGLQTGEMDRRVSTLEDPGSE